ncbi:hypothetical protein ACS0TY_036101 [Phlomoides rotata]
MADEEDDFTFPADRPPCSFESPTLWPPVSRPESSERRKYEQVEVGKFIKLCSCQECKARNKNVGSEDREEKMDLLWENLDERISRKMGEESCDNSSPGEKVQICCVRTLKMSKGNGHTINGLKASILVLIRFLMKKAFSMHDSSSSIKKLAWRVSGII